jgi:CDP-glycerol glycerophosphotransferase
MPEAVGRSGNFDVVSRLVDAVRRRPALYRLARRVVSTKAARRVRSRLQRPAVTVIVPYYNVEAYLADCLDSVLAQSFTDFEVLLVDDGSLDGSRAIAEQYVGRDRRFRLVTRPNGGLGAARNTGVRSARGHFLTFLDSDDELPPQALAVLHHTAVTTGSDIVAGAMERFDSVREWVPSWVPEVHTATLLRTTAEDHLPLLRNLYTCDKLFRRDFWEAEDLWFREGVAYEDQPLVTQLLGRARSIDLIPDIVYRYRARDDRSSISQQTASLKDLRARIAAWRVSRDVIRAEFSEAVYDGWLVTLFQAHFQWYLTSPGTEDDTYWDELSAEVRELADEAPQAVWDATDPPQRILVRLTQLGRRDDVQEFVRGRGPSIDSWPSRVREDGVLLELPLLGDPELPDELFVLGPDRLRISHAIENLHWKGEGGTADSCWISGWAYVRKVDLAKHDQRVTVELRNDDTGEVLAFPADEVPVASFAPPRDDLWCDYSPGRFGVRFPIADLARGATELSWTVWIKVEVAGFTVERPVTRLLRSGSAGVVPAATLDDGSRVIPVWQHPRELRLRVDRGAVTVSEVSLRGDVLQGTMDAATAARLSTISLVRGGAEPVNAVRNGENWRIALPPGGKPRPGEPVVWTLRAWTRDGSAVDVVPARGALDGPDQGALLLETGRTGTIEVSRWSLGAYADEVTVTADGVLEVGGRLIGPVEAKVSLVTRNKRARATGDVVDVTDGRFHATVELRQQKYRFGRWPLPIGEHDVRLAVTTGSGAPAAVPLLVSSAVSARLPLKIDSDQLEGRVVRGPEGGVRMTLQRPVGQARGRYNEHRLRRSGPSTNGLVRGVLMRSYFGEQATDNGLSIQKALQARGSDLPVYWAVQDYSIPVPDGGIPVVVNTTEWFRLLFGIQYYVDNMFQPEYHQKADGQVLVETFHGYPFKQMGLPHWRNLRVSQAQIDSYRRRADDWDYLVSPARYATPLLTRDFGYGGQVLETGYPRNDVLSSPEADDIRAAVRASLGIEDGITAVLYAPTFRDYLTDGDNISVMPDLFDVEEASRALGDGYVLLVRGHAFNARTDRRISQIPRCIEVTDYPEVSDLYLAADAAVVDYSSLRFDFGVTGKPMIFHVPDLQRYQDARGWLFDFGLSAPGPWVDSTAEAADRLLHLDEVSRDHAAAYERFTEDFLDLEDGHAGERVVDAIFVPRGDA